jgi:uncharacterized protein
MAASVSAPVTLGRFVWVELLTPDVDAAMAFYAKVVGWTVTPFQGPQLYNMWTAARGPVGGVMAIDGELKARGVPPHWYAYVSTPDCDATLAQVTQLGGQVVVPPTDIPEVGRFAIFKDRQGAVLALLAPNRGDSPAPADPPQPGEIVWHELGTTDQKAAFDFYHTLFAWNKLDAMEMGPGNVYQMYGRDSTPMGGMYTLDPKIHPQPPSWLHYIEVADVTQSAKLITELGGKILNGPMDVPGGQILMAVDPQGAAFALHTAKHNT